MNTQLQKLIEVLLELRTASMESTVDNIEDTMQKYDMLFLGKTFNCIYSDELSHTLKEYFHIEISKHDLTKLMPIACETLNMKFELIRDSKRSRNSNPNTSCYQIVLW